MRPSEAERGDAGKPPCDRISNDHRIRVGGRASSFSRRIPPEVWLSWPNGPVCPHCGYADQAKVTGLKGKKHRPAFIRCNECREQFAVTLGSG
jgi:transcription elongation factor Elf1